MPCLQLDPRVIRIPIVPGSDPRHCYGDLFTRGVRGVVLEAFGVGNMPDEPKSGWLPWLRDQTRKGLQVRGAPPAAACKLRPSRYCLDLSCQHRCCQASMHTSCSRHTRAWRAC